MKKTLVLGASLNPSRYSHLAVQSLQAAGVPVVAIGLRNGSIGQTHIVTGKPSLQDIHTITLYMNANNQKMWYEYIFSLNPKRIIFNPGAENDELQSLAMARGIEATVGCTLVMLRTGQF
ncbi:MAG: CoA-binding protein [Flavobacteriales bacterium]